MDSEQSAFITAQQKHHRYMVYGKKQRYIEVFQCSGEDMNLVLTGGMPAPVSPAKATPALLSPGMLPSIAPLPPTNIPPPPPPQTAPATSMSQSLPTVQQPLTWTDSALFAQQQAQIIAQHNLLARQSQAQAQNEMLLMNQIAQHNLAVLNQNVTPLSSNGTQPTGALSVNPVLKTQTTVPLMPHHLFPHHSFMMLPPRMPIALQRPPHLAYSSLVQSQTPGVFPMVSHVAVKRSYGDAFNEQATPAKRTYTPTPGSLPVYPQFYPNM